MEYGEYTFGKLKKRYEFRYLENNMTLLKDASNIACGQQYNQILLCVTVNEL